MTVGTRAHHPDDRRIRDAVGRELNAPGELTHRDRELVEVSGLRLVDVLKLRGGDIVLATSGPDGRLDPRKGSLEGLLACDVVNVVIDKPAIREVELGSLDVDGL